MLKLSPLDIDGDRKNHQQMPVGRTTSVVDAGLMVTGTVNGHRSDLVIGGIIEGTVTARSIFIKETRKINGHLRAERIEIAGCFTGRIEAMSVGLLAGSITDATIYHNVLTIDPDASVRGLQPWRPAGYLKNLKENW